MISSDKKLFMSFRSNNTNFFMASAGARMGVGQNPRSSEFSEHPVQGPVPPYSPSSHSQGAAIAQQMHHIQQMMMKNNGSNMNAFSRPPQPHSLIGYESKITPILIIWYLYNIIFFCSTNKLLFRKFL